MSTLEQDADYKHMRVYVDHLDLSLWWICFSSNSKLPSKTSVSLLWTFWKHTWIHIWTAVGWANCIFFFLPPPLWPDARRNVPKRLASRWHCQQANLEEAPPTTCTRSWVTTPCKWSVTPAMTQMSPSRCFSWSDGVFTPRHTPMMWHLSQCFVFMKGKQKMPLNILGECFLDSISSVLP